MAKSYNFRVGLICGLDDDGVPSRRFQTLTDAERYARSQCAKMGDALEIKCLMNGRNGERIAYVRRDNADRVWTDVCQMQDSLI